MDATSTPGEPRPAVAAGAPAPARQVELAITGMHCASCVARVERALRNVPGVQSASVNLATERASVRVSADGKTPNVAGLVAAVRSAGYEAAPAAGRQAAAPHGGHGHPAAPRRLGLVITILGALPLAAVHLLAILPLTGSLAALPHELMYTRLGWISQGLLAAIVLVVGGRAMLVGAVRGLLARTANMDVLVALGALTAFFSGLAGLVTGNAALILFDAAALIVMFVAIGKYLEARARRRAAAALQGLAARVPREALRLVDGRTEPVPVEEIRPGDLLRVPAHSPVPVDGEVVAGQAAVDESMLTGEATPVERRPGQTVLGGTRVADGLLDLRATATGEQSAAARITRLVEEAQASKPPWQRLADRLASVFVPAVILLALLTCGGWLLVGGAPIFALERAIAVLVVACPCALGLAIPTAVLVGTTRAAERGILVRDAAALEAAGRVREVLLDKTGTLTIGRPALARIEPVGAADEGTLLRLVAALDRFSEHPLARAIVQAAEQRRLAWPQVQDFSSRPGGGLRGKIDSVEVLVGSAAWLAENGVDTAGLPGRADALAAEGLTVVWVARGGQVAGLLALGDPLHPESAAAVAALHELGVRARLLSGDRRPAVQRIARELGLDAFEAELAPTDKLARVRAAAQAGHVAMVGDGINDAPALAAADVGIAIGAGADLARQAAPICLVGHSPRLIAEAIRISRASARTMKQNLGWALVYNLVMLPVAIFTPIPPALATAAMMFSSLSVVGNSLRLRRVI